MKLKLCWLLVFFHSALLHAQSSFQPFVDSLAKNYLKNQVGALVIGIYDNGKENIFYYGETSPGSKQKPDSNSVFELGGISGTFTSVLFADLSINGIVKMDEKLQDVLPVNVPAPVYMKIICVKSEEVSQLREFGKHEHEKINYTPYVCFPDPSTKPQVIILCDLATNTTGFPNYPDNFCFRKNKENPFAYYTRENLYDFIKEYRFSKPLGYDYKHSDLGVALLGHALALKTKTDFDTLIKDRIFTPLQMSATAISRDKIQQQNLVTGYNKKGKVMKHWTYDVMAPAGGINSTAIDMMKFLAANLGKEKNYYSNLLDYTHNPRLKLNSKKCKDMEIALGWRINSLGDTNKRVICSDGLTGGYSSYIGFIETNHTGVVILSAVSKPVNKIGIEILKKLANEKL